MASTVKGLREEFLDVMGIPFLRCHHCAARFARVGHRLFKAERRPHDAPFWVKIAIVMGLLACVAIVLYVQRMAHRWPF